MGWSLLLDGTKNLNSWPLESHAVTNSCFVRQVVTSWTLSLIQAFPHASVLDTM